MVDSHYSSIYEDVDAQRASVAGQPVAYDLYNYIDVDRTKPDSNHV